MADEFDSRAAAEDLAKLVEATREAARQVFRPATPEPLFYKLPDGSVTDRKGNMVKPAPEPAQAKGK